MKKFAGFLLLLGSLVHAPGLAQAGTLQVDCAVPGFGLKFSFDAKLNEADPNQQLEQYKIDGGIHFEDSTRPDLEFTDFQIHGAFDNSRGITRIRIRPNIPMMFTTFDSIQITVLTDKHQLISISSFDEAHGPNGGTSGQLCSIRVGGL